MPLLAALQALCASSAFASRAFLPLFLVSLVARFPQLVNWLPLVPERPIVLSERLAWLGSDACLAILLVLAVLEAWAERDGDIRPLFEDFESWLRAGVAFVAALALVDGETASILRTVGDLRIQAAGFHSPDAWPLLVAAGAAALTWILATWRAAILRGVREVGDDLGVTRLLAWLEEAWCASAVMVAILAPLLAILLALAFAALIWAGQSAAEHVAESRRIPCPECHLPARPEARACPSCAQALVPSAEADSRLWPDRWAASKNPGVELLADGRCPLCAERRAAAELLAATPHPCGWPASPSERLWRSSLRDHVSARVTSTTLFAALLGLLPVAGSVAALVLVRIRIAAPLRRYLPTTRRLTTKWKARLFTLPLLLGSGIPLVSAACAALIVQVQARAWLRGFEAAGAVDEARAPTA